MSIWVMHCVQQPKMADTRRACYPPRWRDLRKAQTGDVYRRSIVKTLRVLAARSRNATLMFGTCSNLSRLIAKLGRHTSVRWVLPVRARQRSSS